MSRKVRSGLGHSRGTRKWDWVTFDLLSWPRQGQLLGRPTAPSAPCQATAAQGRADVQRGQDCQKPVSLPGTGHRKLDSRENLALCRKTPQTIRHTARVPTERLLGHPEKGPRGSQLLIHSFSSTSPGASQAQGWAGTGDPEMDLTQSTSVQGCHVNQCP